MQNFTIAGLFEQLCVLFKLYSHSLLQICASTD